MSFFRTVGGRVNANTAAELKVAADGTLFTTFTDDSPSNKLDNAIQDNAAFVATEHKTATKSGFYTLVITVPDDTSKQFYIDWSIATQREAGLTLIEDAVLGNASPVAVTVYNRNRNSGASSAVTVGSFTNAAGDEPTLGGSEFYSHYFPRDAAARHPDGGRLILKNNTVYAVKIDASDTFNNEVSVRVDLAEIDA